MVVGVEVFLVVAVVVAAHSSRLLHSELPFRSLPHELILKPKYLVVVAALVVVVAVVLVVLVELLTIEPMSRKSRKTWYMLSCNIYSGIWPAVRRHCVSFANGQKQGWRDLYGAMCWRWRGKHLLREILVKTLYKHILQCHLVLEHFSSPNIEDHLLSLFLCIYCILADSYKEPAGIRQKNIFILSY